MAEDTVTEAGEALQALRGERPKAAKRREPTFCGDIGMRIATDGTWYYRGSAIRRMPLVKLFSTVLRKEEDGFHYLVTPVEKVSIEVEDAPFVAVAMEVEGDGEQQSLRFRTNLDEEIVAGPEHPLSFRAESDGSFTPFVQVRDALTARIARSVFYDLVELATEREGRLGVWSGGRFFAFPDSAAA